MWCINGPEADNEDNFYFFNFCSWYFFIMMSSMDIDFDDVDVDGNYSDESYLNQDNGSQEYFINGSTEPGVNISATS